MGNSLVQVDSGEIIVEDAGYIGRPFDRDLMIQFGDTLMGVHPAAKEVGTLGMRTVAQLALMTGANPLPGTNGIHAWKDKDGRTCIQFGIGFWRGQAEKEGGILWVDRPRPMTDEERKIYDIAQGVKASICCGALSREVFALRTQAERFGDKMTLAEAKHEVARIGIGIAISTERTKNGRPLQWSADERAERDLLRQLVPVLQRPGDRDYRGGHGWGVGDFVRPEAAALPDGYSYQDANVDLFGDDLPEREVTANSNGIEQGEYEEAKTVGAGDDDSYNAPLPDDEMVVFEASGADFLNTVTALIDRYSSVHAVRSALKKLGYNNVPGASTPEAASLRLKMYRALKAHAVERDAEEAQPVEEATAEQGALFSEVTEPVVGDPA